MKLTDRDLKLKGFKKKRFSDKSGYWWRLIAKSTYLGKLYIIADPQYNSLYLERLIDNDPLLQGKCTQKTLNKILYILNKITI